MHRKYSIFWFSAYVGTITLRSAKQVTKEESDIFTSEVDKVRLASA